jgi:hypothetical protein
LSASRAQDKAKSKKREGKAHDSLPLGGSVSRDGRAMLAIVMNSVGMALTYDHLLGGTTYPVAKDMATPVRAVAATVIDRFAHAGALHIFLNLGGFLLRPIVAILIFHWRNCLSWNSIAPVAATLAAGLGG